MLLQIKKEKKGTGIQVFARFRPQNTTEAKNKGHVCVQFDQDEKTIAVKDSKEQDQVKSCEVFFFLSFLSLLLIALLPSLCTRRECPTFR